MTGQGRHTAFLRGQVQEAGRKQTNTEISHVSLCASLCAQSTAVSRENPTSTDFIQNIAGCSTNTSGTQVFLRCFQHRSETHPMHRGSQPLCDEHGWQFPPSLTKSMAQNCSDRGSASRSSAERAVANSLPLWLRSAYSPLRQSQGLCSLPTSQPQALHLHSSPKAHDKTTAFLILCWKPERSHLSIRGCK